MTLSKLNTAIETYKGKINKPLLVGIFTTQASVQILQKVFGIQHINFSKWLLIFKEKARKHTNILSVYTSRLPLLEHATKQNSSNNDK